MPDSTKPAHIAFDVHAQPALTLARANATDAPPAAIASLRASADPQAAKPANIPVITDAEYALLIQGAIQKLGLPATDFKAPVQALKLDVPGSTLKLGFDQNGTINVYNGRVYRSATTGSYLELQANQLAASTSCSADFGIDIDTAHGTGIYLAVFTIETNLAHINMNGWLYPNGWFDVSATPSNGKILVPFEIASYAYYLMISFLIQPTAADQHLRIYEGTITKVT